MKMMNVLASLVPWPFSFTVMVVLLATIAFLAYKNKKYKQGAYYQVTKHPFLAVCTDKGRYGEYLTYKYLKHMETKGAKFLFNVYIPKREGETTEIDVLMICAKGVFVFESKNYSGWIFGSEHQKNWYQTLPAGRGKSHKEHFYNPVMQNRSHIKHLKALLGEQLPVRSIIVFSDRCTLKSVQIESKDINVINRYHVARTVKAICKQTQADVLDANIVAEIYSKLYPFTQVDETVKKEHIANIHNNLHPVTVPQEKPVEMVDDTQNAVETQEPIEAAVEGASVETEQQIKKCPRCNSDLVLRTATRGANAGNRFYGCSNYPKCKYIQSISNDQTV